MWWVAAAAAIVAKKKEPNHCNQMIVVDEVCYLTFSFSILDCALREFPVS